ncbi:1,4-alpha-glucan branching protein [Vibrio sp. 10N.286.49.C2]|uniref:isoamylase early set domain-containing protein n=1 Tax=unclassified Vibrio TaxID=2614977 RepID=UPI000C83C592|nr:MULTISPECIES: isoamylase early set domain-containing protein [unclassified Vibrio]PMH42817.1 1,4-alpha-glucan branching protein [Vibrio sp. 10N.286.49.C2]PMH53844.1 1,4-alpha-glucan branching protein [Vibrio sp. 10N.286.49.B1]PMH81681.1 1,4-alpha-glucan branching protein [Vibrio sp. 10N.286.48.B7]
MINKRFFKTKDEVEVTFELDATNVDSVVLMAEFHDWQPIQMKKVAKTKSFKYKTRLPKGAEYQFRYLVNDTEWVNDAEADQYVPNGFGADNCIITTA